MSDINEKVYLDLQSAIHREDVLNVALCLHQIKNIDTYNKVIGISVLHNAIHSGNETIVDMLLDAGASLRPYKNGWMETTPLNEAIMHQNHELIENFLKLGANPNFVNAHGHTMLTTSLVLNDPSIFTMLLQHGGNPFVCNSIGITAYRVAKHKEDKKYLKIVKQCHTINKISRIYHCIRYICINAKILLKPEPSK